MLLVGRMLDVAPREDLQGRSQNQVDSVTGQLLYFTSPSPNWETAGTESGTRGGVSGMVLVEAQRRFVSVMEKGSLERFRLSLEREPEECSTTSRVRPRGTYDDLTEYSSQHRNTAADGSIKSFFRVSRGKSTGQTVSREVPLAPERAGEVRTLLRLKEDPSPLGNRGFRFA